MNAFPPPSAQQIAGANRARLLTVYVPTCNCPLTELREEGGLLGCCSCGAPLLKRKAPR